MKHFSSLFLLATGFTTAKLSGRWAVMLLLLVVPLLGRAQYITSFSPTSGSNGTSLVITGSDFTNTYEVTFSGSYNFPQGIGVNKHPDNEPQRHRLRDR